MVHLCRNVLVFITLILFDVTFSYDFDIDEPCSAKLIPGQSVVCVCNATYCDTITRAKPAFGTFVAYTSSEAGLRFRKTSGNVLYSFQKAYAANASTLELDPTVMYQVINGFGGAITDSAGINWKSLKDPQARQHLVNSYFAETGLEYNMVRLPIGGTDFSTRAYTYNDLPEHDNKLTGFNLPLEDTELKIPLIKESMKVATSAIHIVASLWSPPAWMKTSNALSSGFLKKEYYPTLADYFLKFLEKYDECGIPIWGITTTNEPLNGIFTSLPINRLQWTTTDLGNWIANNLGPTIRNSTFKHIKIIGGDDQRFTIPLWFNLILFSSPAALKYLDGMAVHYYFDDVTPPSQQTLALQDYPDKFIINTEACEGPKYSADEKVVLGSWDRARNYAANIIENLNYKSIGWIDWNIFLNEEGGPTLIDNNVDSPIIVSADKQEFYKQPMFYALGHFSKFIPRGSRRIKVKSYGYLPVDSIAFLTSHKTIVMVLFNKGKKRDITVKLGLQQAVVNLEASSITTVEFPYKSLI